jgi:hypothetical protein
MAMFGCSTYNFVHHEDRDLVRGQFPYLWTSVTALFTTDVLSTIALLANL